jgi:hypothetical protein
MSACDRPVSAAILRRAAASRSSRYTVVFTMPHMVPAAARATEAAGRIRPARGRY